MRKRRREEQRRNQARGVSIYSFSVRRGVINQQQATRTAELEECVP